MIVRGAQIEVDADDEAGRPGRAVEQDRELLGDKGVRAPGAGTM